MSEFDPILFREYFPFLKEVINESSPHPTPYIYFDNGATTQKPASVIDCYSSYYCSMNANVHRASHLLSAKATEAFEQSRSLIYEFINANNTKEIIWTKGTTESINLVAQCYGRKFLKKGDEIVLSYGEHHANIVPWQIVAEQTGAFITILPLNDTGSIDCHKLTTLITAKTKIVACNHISNVLGLINPIEKIIEQAKTVGAVTLIDGAQAIGHIPIDVKSLDCDFYVFSAHKMYGPTGVGVLYGKQSLLEQMPPYQGGGEMISQVSFDQGTTFNELPFKFEAGTPNIAGIVSFAKAISFLKTHLDHSFIEYEHSLAKYLLFKLKKIQNVKLLFSNVPDIPIIGFVVNGVHNHDIAAQLNIHGIAVRSGHHCAMPLMDYLSISGCIRVSLSAYNTTSEIDYFIDKLTEIIIDHKVLDVPSNPVEEKQSYSSEPTQGAGEDMVHMFSSLKGWDKKHRQIMLLSKKLPKLPLEKRDSHSLVNGCESLAWLSYRKNPQGVFTFEADSDAKVIRGLLYIVLAVFNHKNKAQILSFELERYFEQLGLMQHLSPSRGNGVRAIVNKIKNIVNLS